MPVVKIEFKLPEEQREFRQAQNGPAYSFAVNDFLEESLRVARGKIDLGEGTAAEGWALAAQCLRDALELYGVIDDL